MILVYNYPFGGVSNETLQKNDDVRRQHRRCGKDNGGIPGRLAL
jgi:hypothetical protein